MLSALVICCVDECGEGGAGVGWGKWVAQVGCHFRIGLVFESLTGQRAEEEAAEREHIDNPNILADCNC